MNTIASEVDKEGEIMEVTIDVILMWWVRTSLINK